ncbi:MAG: hypothetical protein GTO08_07165, partial [Deltaproteobacteria bacterium]|nr:hypothetical protein [Deltaproteobacteria bacterium]
MLFELNRTKAVAGNGEIRSLTESLIRMYRGGNSRYINYYGPPGSITTIPYHKALKLEDGKIGDEKID